MLTEEQPVNDTRPPFSSVSGYYPVAVSNDVTDTEVYSAVSREIHLA